jgi:hypothetical protein
MSYKDGLKQTQADLDSLAALRSPVSVLLGVSEAASQALEKIGLKTVVDLATSPLFSVAAEVAAIANGKVNTLSPAGTIPGGFVVEDGPSDLAGLARADLEVLRALSKETAKDLKASLELETVGDLGRWQPYRAARNILATLGEGYLGDGYAAELVPKLGQYPTERRFYSTIVLDQVTLKDTVDLKEAGPVDLSPALSSDFGFSAPAIGARLTFEQSWYAQGFALGTMLHSLALAPGESTRIAIIDWSRRTAAATSESISETERLANQTTHNRAVSEVQDAVAKEVQKGFSHAESEATTETAGGGFGLALGPLLIGGAGGIGHSTTSASSFSSSTGSRNLSASMTQKVMDSTQQAASSSRNRRASIVQEVSQEEHESVSTRIVANYNHMHALTVQYYEVVQLYRVTVGLSEVERLLFVPMKMLEFNDEIVRRYQGVLAAAAIDRRSRELLTTEFGSVRIASTVRVAPAVKGARTALSELRSIARRTTEAELAAPTPTPESAAGPSGTEPSPSPSGPITSGPSTTREPGWDHVEIARAARLTSSNVARAGSTELFLPTNTLFSGLTLTTDKPTPTISAVTLRLQNGQPPHSSDAYVS